MQEIISRSEALALGLTQYFTGKPCVHGHLANRQTSNGTCCKCRDIRALEWSKRNKPARRAIEKRMRQNNPELAARNNERTKAWQAANREKHLQTKRAWKDANPERNRYYVAKRKARIARATLPGFEEAIKQIYLACPPGYHVDHIMPLQHPLLCGLHVPWNLQYLPAIDNMRKSNKVDELST